MGNTATLSSKFQISIPKEMCEKEGWKPGQELSFIPSGAGYKLVRIPTREELFGIARGANPEGYRDEESRDERYKNQ
jgi:bifunctional DNA-binding transcriptional regulator/antitoxin component of YhaV-PrlF toxin-antitoxin module